MNKSSDMPFLVVGLILGGLIGFLIGKEMSKPHPEYYTTRRKIKGVLTEVKHLN